MTTIHQYSILRYIIVAVLSLSIGSVYAQPPAEGGGDGPTKKEKKAEKLYEDLSYKVALDAYGDKTGANKYDLDDMIRIAESYRKNADYYNAEKWYGQVVKKSSDPIYYLYYAQSLQANGHYVPAKEFFEKFDEEVNKGLGAGDTPDRRGEYGAQACAAVQNFRYAKDVEVWNVAELNTKKLDFSPTYIDGGVLFASTRDQATATKRLDSWINDNFMDIFYAEKGDGGKFNEPVALPEEINSKFHEGPLCITPGNDVMYFTRNNYLKGKRGKDDQDITLLKIYAAEKRGDEWTNVTELPFNGEEYHSCHPTVSSDGQKLYFASDRPGGYGGLDIYVSTMLEGTWGEPVNLGEGVNTPGTEAFPFIHESGVLYFGSNGLPGLGGLDIFTTTPSVMAGETVWGKAENLGKPFNSKKDDFGFIMDEEGMSGYFTSSRKGGKGEDDIYSWKSKKELEIEEPEDVMVTGIVGVCDAVTGERIVGAKVVAYEKVDGMSSEPDSDYVLGLKPTSKDGDYVLSIKKAGGSGSDGGGTTLYTTNEKGEFEYSMKSGSTYAFKAVKAGYEEGLDEYEVEVVMAPTTIQHCIPLTKRNCTQLTGKVYNAVYKGKIIPGANVSLMNKCTGDVTEVLSAADGSYEFCLECDCDYELVGSKTNFSTDKQPVTTIKVDCSKPIVQDLNLLFGLFDALVEETPGDDPAGTNPMEGRSIVLEKLYYDFDQSYIRPDAATELDKVVALLREFPSMEIELSSHTDARGTDKYNADLSQRRANEAVAYIIGRGINASRITAKGYGEQYPRNRCRDEVECTEEEHQHNRRTEVKITKFARYNEIDVDYKDNAPSVIDPADPNRKWIWD